MSTRFTDKVSVDIFRILLIGFLAIYYSCVVYGGENVDQPRTPDLIKNRQTIIEIFNSIQNLTWEDRYEKIMNRKRTEWSKVSSKSATKATQAISVILKEYYLLNRSPHLAIRTSKSNFGDSFSSNPSKIEKAREVMWIAIANLGLFPQQEAQVKKIIIQILNSKDKSLTGTAFYAISARKYDNDYFKSSVLNLSNTSKNVRESAFIAVSGQLAKLLKDPQKWFLVDLKMREYLKKKLLKISKIDKSHSLFQQIFFLQSETRVEAFLKNAKIFMNLKSKNLETTVTQKKPIPEEPNKAAQNSSEDN